jgi:hypothetical protein
MKLAMNSEKNRLPMGVKDSGNVQKKLAVEVSLGGRDRMAFHSYWSIAEI